MYQDLLTHIAGLEALIRQQNIQLSLNSKTEAELRHALKQAENKATEHEQEAEELRSQLDKLRRMLFGSRSEKLQQQKTDLESKLDALVQKNDEQGERENEPLLPRQLRQPRKRRPFPEHLPREIKRLSSPDECCPECGGRLAYLGEDSAEQLEMLSAALKVIRTIREKYACVKCDCIVQAAAPSRPIERGIAGKGLLAWMLISKYCDHLPLNRLSEMLARQGLPLSRSLLSGWVEASCRLPEPLDEALYNYVMGAWSLHADETPVQVQSPGKTKTERSYLWTYVRDERPFGTHSPPAVWFAWSAGRNGKYAEEHLAGFGGKVLQVDGYAGYNSQFTAQRENGLPLKRAGCTAHARRKIYDIWINARRNPTLMQALALIRALYATEAEIRGQSAECRLAIRQEKSLPLMLSLKALIDEKQKTLSKKSRLSKAFAYIENHWDALCCYCHDGHVEIDNNAAERAIRAVAVGRRNWMFFGSARGGERGAMLYSLLGTCKLNGVDPEAWLRHVLGVLPDWPSNRVKELLPWNVDLTSV